MEHSSKHNEGTGWDLYDQLIEGIPEGIEIEDCLIGLYWTLVRSSGVGISMTPPERNRRVKDAGSLRGRKVQEIAGLMKSWNPLEAALGVAAANSYYNAPGVFSKTWDIDINRQSQLSAFEYYLDEIKGKKVAVIGHFPGLEHLPALCDLSILERRPRHGDLPDPACEYILPGQDVVFITASTLINKTLPRLLAIADGRTIVIVGPSTPLTPLLFPHGATMLAGTMVTDEDSVWRYVAEGGERSIFGHGTRVVKAGPAMVREA